MKNMKKILTISLISILILSSFLFLIKTPTVTATTPTTYTVYKSGSTYYANTSGSIAYTESDAGDLFQDLMQNDVYIDVLAGTYTWISHNTLMAYPSSLHDIEIHGEPGTTFDMDSSYEYYFFGICGLTELTMTNLKVSGIIFDSTGGTQTDYSNCFEMTGGTLTNAEWTNNTFIFTQVSPATNYFQTTAIQLDAGSQNIYIYNNTFSNVGLDSVVPIRLYSGSNTTIDSNEFFNCNNPGIVNSGEIYEDWTYTNNVEYFSSDVAFPCEGIDLEGVNNFLVQYNTQVFQGIIPEHAGGIVIGSAYDVTNGYITDNIFGSNLALVTMTLDNMNYVTFSNNTSSYSLSDYYVDGAGNPIDREVALLHNVFFDSVPILVQDPIRETTTSNSFSVTLSSAPTAGDVLVATIGLSSSASVITSSITESGVSWQLCKSNNLVFSPYLRVEIWVGVVGASASSSISISLSGTVYVGVVNIAEYSGVSTSGFVDRTANSQALGSYSNTVVSTGTTETTRQSNELWVGVTFSTSDSEQSSPINGFTLSDGAVLTNGANHCSLGYLDKIVIGVGSASTTTTTSTAGSVIGCIITLKGQYYLTVSSSSGTTSGQGWYNPGASATFNIIPGNSVFLRWVGIGTGSYTGTARAYTVTMNNDIIETAEWQTEFSNGVTNSSILGDGSGIAGGSIFDIMATNASKSTTFFTGLVSYWTFDEATGTSAIDSSGYDNTGTFANTPSWTIGKYSSAIEFEHASSQYMSSASTNFPTDSDARTFSAWIYPTSFDSYSIVFTYGAGSGTLFNCFITITTGELQIGNGAVNWASGLSLTLNEWNFVCVSYALDASTAKIYVNDDSASVDITSALATSAESTFYIGSNNAGEYSNFKIDDFRVYNISLTPTQANQLYTISPGSSYTVSTSVPNFQSFSAKVNLYQSAIWYVEGDCWDAPTYDFNTGYLEYGISYEDPLTNITCPGWYVRISIIGGNAGTFTDSAQAYVELQCDWYDAGNLTKTDYLICAYDAYRANDTTTEFELYINLWLSNQNSNSMVGGAVTAVYYGVTETGWGPWATWGPVEGLSSQSLFYDNLYDSNGDLIVASNLQNNTYDVGLFNVWTSIAKTSIGSGPYSDNLHTWAVTCKNLEFNSLPYGATLIGINSPSILPTTTFDNPVGFFAQVGNSISSALNSMVQAISTLTSSASGVGADVLNKAFSSVGITDAATSISSFTSDIGQYFGSAITYISGLLTSFFTIISSIGITAITWLGHFVDKLVVLGGDVYSLLTTGSINGIPLIDTFQLSIITEFLGKFGDASFILLTIIFILAWWFNSLDKRAKQYGGGWNSFFMADIQSCISIFSFVLDLFWRIVTTVIDMGTRFLNLFL